jgi:hypothetical protein
VAGDWVNPISDRALAADSVMVEPRAGMPLLMPPRRGHSRDTPAYSAIVTAYMQPRHTTDGTTDPVADSTLYRADHRHKLATMGRQWITRVPATRTDVQDALAHAIPEALEPLVESSRDHLLASTYGGVAPAGCWSTPPIAAPQAQRSVEQHWRPQCTAATPACHHLCRTALVCTAAAQHALTTCRRG